MKNLCIKMILVAFVFCVCLVFIDLKKWPMGGFRKEKLLTVDRKGENFLPPMAQAILNQPYTYLDRGTQSFVFESEDGKYVLKFLRSDRLKKSIFSYHNSKKNEKDLIKACQLAHEKLSEMTGIVGIHQSFSKDLPHVFLRSKMRQTVKLDINNFCFVLQKKALALDQTFLKAKKNNDIEYAKGLIHSFFNLLKTRSKALISNSDPNLFDNFAVVENRVIEIDFGDYFHNPPLEFNRNTYFHEIDRFARPLRDWMTENWPEILSQFDLEYEQVRFYDSKG